MKKCAHCKQEKPLDEFAWSNKLLKRRQKHCRDCMKMFNRQSYLRRSEKRKEEVAEAKKQRILDARQYVWDYLSVHPCIECGELVCPRKCGQYVKTKYAPLFPSAKAWNKKRVCN